MAAWFQLREVGTRSPHSTTPASQRIFRSSPPPVERFSNGWKAARCQALRPSNSNEDKMNQSEMRAKIAKGDGFIAALDQSGGSTPKALTGYGYQGDEWSSEEEMFDLIHKMRSRIISAPCFGSGKVIGAILFERTMDGEVGGKPVPQALIDLGVVP